MRSPTRSFDPMAHDTFSKALALVLEQEGGYVDHPADSGGPTRYGITLATLARARGVPVSADDVRALTESEAGAIYRDLFWNAVRADELPPGLDLATFDAAVHSGPGRAARLLQATLGVPQDGIVGPVTLGAAQRADSAAAIRALSQRRLQFLSGLAGWPVFGRGWRRRTLAVERAAPRLAGDNNPSPADLTTEISMYDTK